MFWDMPPSPPVAHEICPTRFADVAQNWTPGCWRQDLLTLPLEAGLAWYIPNHYTIRSQPLWPFAHERADAVRGETRHPRALLIGLAGGLWVGLEARFYEPLAEDAPVLVTGLMHAHLLTEILTSTAKTTFQRKRPFYETAVREGTVRDDDRFSFFSGHASHAFAFATWMSLYARQQSESPWEGWAWTGALYGLAGVVASARAVDHQHNWSDVMAGAAVGSLVSWGTWEHSPLGRRKDVTLVPSLTENGPALNLQMSF